MECAKENSGGVVEKCETEVDKRRRAAQKANLRKSLRITNLKTE